MHMNDLIFSMDTSEEAQTVATSQIDLLSICNFQLVKWTVNKFSKSVLATVAKDKLASSVRTIDLKT